MNEKWLEEYTALDTQPEHVCPAKGFFGSPTFLEPPHRAGRVHLGDDRYRVRRECKEWLLHIDTEDVAVIYCPWCGEKLPTNANEE